MVPTIFSSVQQEPILAVALHVPVKVLQHNTSGFLRKLCSALLALELAVCHCRSILEQRVEHLQDFAVFSWQKHCYPAWTIISEKGHTISQRPHENATSSSQSGLCCLGLCAVVSPRSILHNGPVIARVMGLHLSG